MFGDNICTSVPDKIPLCVEIKGTMTIAMKFPCCVVHGRIYFFHFINSVLDSGFLGILHSDKGRNKN